jgi:MFS family permease
VADRRRPGVYTFGFFAVHTVASAWVGQRAGTRRGLVSALYLSSYYLGGSVIGTATGWAWSQAGWPGVIAAMLACGGAVIGIACAAAPAGGRLRRHRPMARPTLPVPASPCSPPSASR